jgi:Ca-activated chloride channel family protein
VRFFIALPSVLVLFAPSHQDPLFRTRIDVVAVSVTVTDRDGRPVRRLTQPDFRVAEEGRTHAIEYFSSERVPLSLVLAVDASESMMGERFRFAEQAAANLLNGLGPDDEVAVIGFNDLPFTVSSWTTNTEAVRAALAQVTPKGATALYAAITTSLSVLRSAKNRRVAIIVISDGHDFRWNDLLQRPDSKTRTGFSPAELRSLRERPVVSSVQRSEALVYAIGVDAPQRSNDPNQQFDRGALERLTDPTGGYTRVVTNERNIPAAADAIRDELNHQYVLGFIPEHLRDGRFHRITVTVNGCECRVRARAGFVADRSK